MRPILLEMQAFGPYIDRQIIDFERLSSNGMFLIKGPTGSGKTTIFDAMTFALYGGSTGEKEGVKGGRNDLNEWRCNQAPDDLSTIVSFTFLSGGKKYRFTRKLEIRRKNFATVLEAGEYNDEGECIPFFQNPKLNDLKTKAQEILGLSKEQFRQVVLLPQGQFETFILSSSGEKEIILNQLFDSGCWYSYAEAFYRKVYSRKEALDKKKASVDAALQSEGFESIEQMDEHIKLLSASLDELEQSFRTYDAEKKQKLLADDIALSKEFEQLNLLRERKAELDSRKEEIADLEVKHKEALEAEAFRALIKEYETCKAGFEARNASYESIKKSIPSVKETVTKLTHQKKEYESESPVEKNNKLIGEYESKRKVYEQISEYKASRDKKEAELKASIKALTDAEKKLNDLKTEEAQALKIYNNADIEAAKLRQVYLAGITGEIASELEAGKPCPVCGSTEHPHPAVKGDGSVSKAELKDKEAYASSSKKIWEECSAKTDSYELTFKELEGRKAEADKELAQAKTIYEEASRSLIKDIPDLKTLDKNIDDLKTDNKGYIEHLGKLEEDLKRSEEELNKLLAREMTANQELTKAQTLLRQAEDELHGKLEGSSFKTVEDVVSALCDESLRNDLHKRIIEYRSTLEENKKAIEKKAYELKGKNEPDTEALAIRQKQITDFNNAYIKDKTRMTEQIKRLTPKLESLKADNKEYEDNIHEANDDLAFAKQVRGDSSFGLARYVLAIKFDQIIGHANRLLARVHDGRYRLYRSDEKGVGNKRGLELKVRDSRSLNGGLRDVRMLSGGEKFLVSLALSIGMSAVAQTSGVQIDTLFIDEGFGTLDESSINDAMEVLHEVGEGSLIGIISHVKLLEENISTGLEVVKTSEGNYITQI